MVEGEREQAEPRKPEKQAEPAIDATGPSQAWNGLIQVAGAVAGLAALVYFVGAVTMWARMRAAGLPADVIIQHLPRGQLIALGIRGVFTVSAMVVAPALLAYGVCLLAAYGWRRPPEQDEAARLRERTFLDIGTDAARRLQLGHMRLLLALAVAALLAVSFVSWRWLAAVLLAAVSGGATIRYLRQRPDRVMPTLAQIIVVALAAGASGIAWQIQAPIKIQTAVVDPPPAPELADVALPYLGESDKTVFVAEVAGDPNAKPPTWTYTRRVLEVPRDDVRLIFPAVRGELSPDVPPPAQGLWRLFARA